MSTVPARANATGKVTDKKSVRHRKIIRDSIQGITRPALKRLMNRAGILRISGLVYEESRGVMKVTLANLMRQVIIAVEHTRMKTVKLMHVKFALEALNQKSIVAAYFDSKEIGKKVATHRKIRAEPANGVELKPHRFRPDVATMRDIRRIQKSSSGVLSALPFARLVREVSHDFSDYIRFGAHAMEIIRLYMETYMIDLYKASAFLALSAKRVTLMPKDIQGARAIREERN